MSDRQAPPTAAEPPPPSDEPRSWRDRDALLWLIVVAAVLAAIAILGAVRPT